MRTLLLCGIVGVTLLVAGCPKGENTTAATEGAQQTASASAPETASPAATPGTPAAPATASVDKPEELVGKAAPDFTLKDFDGNEHHLANYTSQGKIVIVEWFDYECGATNAYYASKDFVKSMNDATQGKDDVVWLSIVSSAPGKPGYDPAGNKKHMPEHGKVNQTLRDEDGAIGHEYGAHATPTVYVIDKTGKVAYAGAYDEAASPPEAPKGKNLVLAAVDAVRAGKAPEVTSKPAFG